MLVIWMMLYISFCVHSFKEVYVLVSKLTCTTTYSVSKCFSRTLDKDIQDDFRILIFTYVQILSIAWFFMLNQSVNICFPLISNLKMSLSHSTKLLKHKGAVESHIQTSKFHSATLFSFEKSGRVDLSLLTCGGTIQNMRNYYCPKNIY